MQTDIAAPAADAWRLLTQVGAWSSWNNQVDWASTDAASLPVGASVEIQFHHEHTPSVFVVTESRPGLMLTLSSASGMETFSWELTPFRGDDDCIVSLEVSGANFIDVEDTLSEFASSVELLTRLRSHADSVGEF